MFTYKPGNFYVSLYATPIGPQLWDFLNRPETIARLETASELSKPALQGIGEQLLREFGKDVLDKKDIKQMIGDMVLQIMEWRGWEKDIDQGDQGKVEVRLVPFISASCYRRPDWVTFYVFHNKSNRSDIAITDCRKKAPLPPGVSWTYYTSFDSPLKAKVAFDVDDFSQLRQQVQADGYYRTLLPAVE